MHQLFVVTSCRYTLTGLDGLMREAGLPVRVIRVSMPEEVLATPAEHGNRAILIVMPAGEPAARAAGRVFLWRWGLWRPALQTGMTPCLLFGDSHEGSLAGAYPLSRHLPLSSLSALLSGVLKTPACYVRSCSRGRPLSAMQSVVLEATLAGEPVPVTAARLGVAARSVFACRTALIQKLGLRNRMELMCLNRRDVL